MSVAIRRSPTYTTNYGGLTPDDQDAATANTNTFIAACDAIQSAGGGVLEIPPGAYYVGKQDFAGAAGLGYAYRGYDVIDIQNCTKPIRIIAGGVKLIMVDGLHFGSFDPVTGAAMGTKQTQSQYRAAPQDFIRLYNNTGPVSVEGPLELDGNIDNLVIGGEFGDTGYQIENHGCNAQNNGSFSARDVYAHHLGTDGFITKYYWANTRDIAPILLENCRSLYNGRQGWSIIGGNKITGINCDFSHTGQNAAGISSNPNYGIDIENESEAIKDVTLIRVRCHNNGGAAIGSTNTVRGVHCYDCEFIGTNNFTMWPSTKGWKLYNCKVVGPIFAMHDGDNDEDAFQAYGTLFTSDPAESPTGDIYHIQSNLGGTKGKFDGCTFVSYTSAKLPAFDATTTIHNCVMRALEPSPVSSHTCIGNYTGRNIVEVGEGSFSISTGANNGELVLNGVSYGRGKAVVETAARTMKNFENGTTYFLSSATEFAMTLPVPVAGLEFEFIVSAAPSGASYRVITNGSSNIFKGQVYSADLDAAADGDIETSGGDTISFVDAKAVAGDRVVLKCDGTNWFAYCFCSVFDAITITTAS